MCQKCGLKNLDLSEEFKKKLFSDILKKKKKSKLKGVLIKMLKYLHLSVSCHWDMNEWFEHEGKSKGVQFNC